MLVMGFNQTLLVSALLFTFSQSAQGRSMRSLFTPDQGFTPINVVTPQSLKNSMVSESKFARLMKNYCNRLNSQFKRFGWTEKPCGDLKWQAKFRSTNGHPLIYQVFGEGPETTLLLSAVHPDEYTPVPMGFRLAKYLEQNKNILGANKRIVIAPLVNPDGFLRNVPSRTNANGVDPNRNFYTADWYDRSKEFWAKRKKRNPRYFPGYFPNTELETFFQMQLIEEFKPDKILSIHAPLGFLDYDGPGDQKFRTLSDTEKKAKQLAHAVSKKSRNYRVVDYSFYPGSLGNYAGNERNIPTVTLELETTNAKKVDAYWEQFLPGMLRMVDYPFQISKQFPPFRGTEFIKRYLSESGTRSM